MQLWAFTIFLVVALSWESQALERELQPPGTEKPDESSSEEEVLEVNLTPGTWVDREAWNLTNKKAAVGNAEDQIFICRVRAGSEIIPGWETDLFPGCNYAYRRRVISARRYQMLLLPDEDETDYVYVWEPQRNGTICLNPIIGGVSGEGQPYLVCRAEWKVTLVGKMKIGQDGCRLPIKNKEVVYTDYEILCAL